MQDTQTSPASRVRARHRSVAAGRDANIGEWHAHHGNQLTSQGDLRVAGRDYHEHHHHDADVVDPWFRELQHRFAKHASNPRCMHCDHCGLQGQPPKTDTCRYCGNDIGAEHRIREAAEARRKWWLRRLGDMRFGLCFVVAVLAVSLILYNYPKLLDGRANTTAGGLLGIVLFTGFLEQLVMRVELWMQHIVPRWMRQHRLGWLLRDPN